jgi:hypothetical protein
MDFSEACLRLANHGNLPSAGPEAESLGYALWLLRRGDESAAARFPVLYEDVVDCLEVVNIELNGEVPSETPNTRKQMAIDRWLAYSIVGILGLHLEALPETTHVSDGGRERVLRLLREITIAWDAVLAGDIDSLREHIALEY